MDSDQARQQALALEQHLDTYDGHASSDHSAGSGPDDDQPDVDRLSHDFAIDPSISRLQTRLKLPTTPAAEKAAALDNSRGGFFDDVHDLTAEPEALEGSQVSLEESQNSLKGPQVSSKNGEDETTSQSTTQKKVDESNSFVHASEAKDFAKQGPRARASTVVTASSSSQEKRQRRSSLMSFSFAKGSTSKILLPTMHAARSWLHGVDPTQDNKSLDLKRSHHSETASNDAKTAHTPQIVKSATTMTTSGSSSNPPRPSLVRRTTSDGSLRLARAMSYASSLGDDSRWDDVHEMSNSRMKAIRDTIADSNLKIPRIPTFSSLSLGSFSLEFGSSRKGSETNLAEKSQPKTQSSRDSSRHSFVSKVRKPSRSRSPASESRKLERFPQFSRALKHLTGDLVILGGYRGSVLRSATPPCRQLWVPIKVGLNLRKVDLEVGLEPEADEEMEQHIKPSGMLKNIGPVEITRRLFKRLKNSQNCKAGKLRVWDYGYDWRLSPQLLSQQLLDFLERLPSNRPGTPADQRGATVIAHSLGGLITRHVVNRRPDLFSGVIYAGAPKTCVNILGPLRNGDDVLFSSKVLTAQVNFTIRTSFALLPLDGKCFVDKDTGEEYRVDFFDPETWAEYRLSPCVARPLPVEEISPSLKDSLVESVTNMLPKVTSRGHSDTKHSNKSLASQASDVRTAIERKIGQIEEDAQPVAPHINHNQSPERAREDPEVAAATAVTISREDAIRYLQRVLPEVKKFKEELAFKPEIEARQGYPPAAVIYGKTVPTVIGARVKGREGIKHADAYDDLLFASGDGVVLARASQLPDGYRAVKGGVVSTDRGHIALLADLEAVGQCLNALRIDQKNKRSRSDLR